MDIVFENATASYRRREAPVLDALNLTVAPGRTILLGPNGAGKSTLLAIAASAMTLRTGSIAVGGLEPSGRRALARYRRVVGWMPQSIAVAGGLSVREHVALHGWLAGLGRAEAMSAAVETLAMVQLDDLQSRRATSLSGGQRARMGLAQALARGADVLLLDEPTAALDPDQRDSFLSLLACVAEGRTVLVSTHDVGDLTETYDRVVVLDRGRIRFDGTVRAFVDTGAAPLAPVEAYRRALGGG